MAEKYYQQNSWSSGVSESEFIGQKGSFSNAYGIDIHSEPGVIQPSLLPIEETGGKIINFCKFAVDSSGGSTFFFGDSVVVLTNGNIYYRSCNTSTGIASWGTTYVFSQVIGKFTGASEFDGYIYWAVTDPIAIGESFPRNLHRMSITGTDVVAWGSITLTAYNPMVDMGTYLLIGGGTILYSVSDGTLTAGGIPDVSLNPLPNNYSISCLHKYGIDVLVGTTTSGGGTGAKLLRWDLASAYYTQEIDVPETSINCFLSIGNQTYFQAGNKGNIYLYDGIGIIPYKKIPQLTEGGNASCNPKSSANFGGIGYFGISSGYSLSFNPGLYSLGRKNNSFPIVLCHEFPSSKGSINQMSIGAIISGKNSTGSPYLLFSWKNESSGSCGIDSIYNTTSRVPTSYIETQSIMGDRFTQKQFQNYAISYKQKPSGTDISLDYFKNYSTGTSRISLTDKSDYNNMVADDKIDAGAMKFRITMGSTTSYPKVSSFYTSFNEREVI